MQRELVEQRYVRRSDGIERVREALRRLGEVGSPAGILARSAEELGASSEFEIVLVSRVADKGRPAALWVRDGATDRSLTLADLADGSFALRYPSIEAEVTQRPAATIVSVTSSQSRAAPELVQLLGWQSYVVAPITLEGRAIGLLHAARLQDGGALDEIDLELAALYADGLARVFEQAALREQLGRQRQQLQSAAAWVSAQIAECSSRSAPVTVGRVADGGGASGPLTARELEVMHLIARGQSNRAIASSLVLGEGTVKYHVKNILRKLSARSRAEAISRYIQLYGGLD